MRSLVTMLLLMASFVVVAGSFNEISDPLVKESLRNLWGDKRESVAHTTLVYTPRLISYTAQRIVLSKTLQRFAKLGKSLWTFGKAVATEDKYPLFKKGALQFADSPVNVLGLANDMISDLVMITKTFYHAAGVTTSRIRLCTSNLISNLTDMLTPIHFFNPAYHLGLIVDGDYYETRDMLAESRELRRFEEQDGLSCVDTTVLSNEPISLAIERTICVDRKLELRYDFFNYNCGGYTRDVIDLSGLSYPGFLNIGIGAEIGIIDDKSAYESHLKMVKSECDDHVLSVREMISRLERGIDLAELKKHLVQSYNYGGNNPTLSRDLIVQLHVSAFRGNNLHNKNFILIAFEKELERTLNGYYTKDGELDERYLSSIVSIYRSMDEGQIERLAEYSETFYRIYDDLRVMNLL